MLTIKTKLENVPSKGVGLIADQDIRKGQTVWTFNPVIDIKIKKSDVPEEAKEFFDTYSLDTGKDFLYVNIDNARFINHSDNPNTKNLGMEKENIAIQDIDAGEEITINYREIDIGGIDFSDRSKRKSSIKGKVMLLKLIKLADVLDANGLHEEANVIDRIAVRRFDPMTNPLPSKMKEVLDNPIFNAAVRGSDFEAAKDIALSTIMESDIADEDKKKILYNIEKIEGSEFGASVQELQKYLYNSWLKYIGLGVVSEEVMERLIKLADVLDGKGLFDEANRVDVLVHEGYYISQEEIEKIAPKREERRSLSLPIKPEAPGGSGSESSTCPGCQKPIFTTNIPCPSCGYVSEKKEQIEEI